MKDNTILIKNALILNPNNFENKEQSLLIKNDVISEISDEIDEGNVDKVIDATGKILLPGFINTHTHLIEGVILSQIANENDYRRPAWQTTGNLYNEYIKIGDFPQIKRNDWRLDDSSNRPQAIYISCAEDNKNISIYYDYLYF